MTKVAVNLDLTTTSDTTSGLSLDSNQPALIGIYAWGTGGTVTPIFTSTEGGTEIVQSAVEMTEANNENTYFESPVAGVLQLKVTATGSAGNVTGELTTDDTRSW